ncbi:MAG: hypothetical protein U0T36_06475 [Saprospiraceae bacterium]
MFRSRLQVDLWIFIYLECPPAQVTSTASGLGVGTYTVTVTDVNVYHHMSSHPN